jgi:hypothetical protein
MNYLSTFPRQWLANHVPKATLLGNCSEKTFRRQQIVPKQQVFYSRFVQNKVRKDVPAATAPIRVDRKENATHTHSHLNVHGHMDEYKISLIVLCVCGVFLSVHSDGFLFYGFLEYYLLCVVNMGK